MIKIQLNDNASLVQAVNNAIQESGYKNLTLLINWV